MRTMKRFRLGKKSTSPARFANKMSSLLVTYVQMGVKEKNMEFDYVTIFEISMAPLWTMLIY